MKTKYIFLFLFFILGKNTFSQTRIGIDCGQPIDNTSGIISQGAGAPILSSTCTPWVRVNFILGPWNSPEDTTLYNGKTWLQTYNTIIDSLVNSGIEVYALVGAQIVSQPINDDMIAYPGADSIGAVAWKDEYIYNFVKVVDYFKDRIRVFESYNEPNNWDNGFTAVVHPQWFALMLQDIYLNVKYFNGHWGDPDWQVTLVSGAILTLDVTTGASYINDVYWYGENIFAWNWTFAQTGSYPLDGVGMHIYVEQGSSDPATVSSAMNYNINDFWNNITFYEGSATPKQIWVSEFGWESASYGELFQADNLTTSFSVLRADPRIAMALWFTLSDWPGGDWGIYYFGSFLPSERKLAYYAFLNETNCILTSTETNSSSIQISAYPNPASGIIHLTDPASGMANAEIEIYNLIGEKIYNTKINAENKTIDLSDKGSGIYFIRIIQNNKTITSEKLIITR